MKKLPFALIITGPTASGKTALSYELASALPIEIVNADVGQLYAPLSIGTAKPDLSATTIPHHLFDLLGTPEQMNVLTWRTRVIDTVLEVTRRGNIPVLVGGSLFYIRSLFFPPQEADAITHIPDSYDQNNNVSAREQWELLLSIDPDRAAVLHPNDRYRVQRALTIWYTTGQKPSIYQPIYSPPFESMIVFVDRARDVLRERIFDRTHQMLDQGWIEEAAALKGTAWEDFVRSKNFIGYTEIFNWLDSKGSKEALIERIATLTWQYAKRQQVFWKTLQADLTKNRNSSPLQCTVISSGLPNEEIVKNILDTITKEGRA